MSAEQVRGAMLEAAHDLLGETGATLSLDTLRLETVIARAGVPRSSAYRIWPSRGDFLDELLERMAGPGWYGTGAFDPQTLYAAVAVLRDHPDLLATLDGRRALLREAIRVGAAQNYDAIASSPSWRIYIALVGTAHSTRDAFDQPRVARALAASEAEFLRRMAEFYELVAGLLGMRLRDPGRTWEHVAAAGAAAVEGLALRRALVEAVSARAEGPPAPGHQQLGTLVLEPLPGPALDGELTDWSLAALSFYSIFDGMIEWVPEFAPPAPEDLPALLAQVGDIAEGQPSAST